MENVYIIQIVESLVVIVACFLLYPLAKRWGNMLGAVLARYFSPLKEIELQHTNADGTVVKVKIDLTSKKKLVRQLESSKGDTDVKAAFH